MNQSRKNTLIVLLGPTASGKTAIGVEVAQWLGTEIISADSRQVYREMNIGTAKPSADQLLAVKHHLIGHISINENYNAGRFEKEALAILSKIFTNKKFAMVVGGTGLYIDALCNGLDELPESDPGIRRFLKEQHEIHGIQYLQKELEKNDPVYFRFVDIHNPSRLMRALEVIMITGRPYSSFRKGKRTGRDFEIIKIGLLLPRQELITRIRQRTDEMMRLGLLEEVNSLLPFKSNNALNTVGYRELFDFLDGKCSLEQAIEKIKINTSRYAKRQMTWFGKDNEIAWFTPDDLEGMKKFLVSGF